MYLLDSKRLDNPKKPRLDSYYCSASDTETETMSATYLTYQGPVDPMFVLKRDADNDVSPDKVDLGVGIYRNTEGKYHELGVVREAKRILEQNNPGHDYESTTGNPAFLKDAAAVMFGEGCEALKDGRIASVQTISGTGANHLAALFLARCAGSNQNTVYLGTPTWGNYDPLCSLAGLQVVKYQYYDPRTATVDFTTLLDTVSSAPPNSIFILQGCCHNPTGADLTPSQWQTLAEKMKQAAVFPFMDIAYQGLGGSMDDDAYPIRLFTQMGFEMVVCQSFSKNLGLYGERCGVLHVVNSDAGIAARVYDQLRCLIRWEFSSSPAYGSRLAGIVMGSGLKVQWSDELDAMRFRLLSNRQKLYQALENTPGNWSVILTTKGLFCFLPLNPRQCQVLRTAHHIHLPDNGRINISGLNSSNTDQVASAIDSVVRDPKY